jgi:hypothetical protein
MLTSSFKKSFNATPIGISMSTFFNLGARIRRMNHKKWHDMTNSERFQLVGPAYTKILPPEEQIVKATYGTNGSKNVHFDGEALVIARSTVPVKDLVDKLRSEGQLDAFLALINRMAKSKEKKSA